MECFSLFGLCRPARVLISGELVRVFSDYIVDRRAKDAERVYGYEIDWIDFAADCGVGHSKRVGQPHHVPGGRDEMVYPIEIDIPPVRLVEKAFRCSRKELVKLLKKQASEGRLIRWR